MNVSNFRQARLRIPGSAKRQVRTQFGALCWRLKDGDIQILLITSRRRGRWIIPKGWPMNGQTASQASATEAWEEAGAEGVPGNDCIGMFSYQKMLGTKRGPMPCMVAVFPFQVERLRDDFPERGQRRRKWVSPSKAAKMVDEKDLAKIILHFAPHAPESHVAPG